MAEYTNTNHKVTCGHCKTDFKGFEDQQANGCATDLYDDGLIAGHYGSAVADGNVYRFASAHTRFETRLFKPCQICDTCMTSFIENGVVIEV